MADDDKISVEQSLTAIMAPLARLMIENNIMLNDALTVLKMSLIEAAKAKVPDASASHLSLMTGVHRKDAKAYEQKVPLPERASAAARVLTLWNNTPEFTENGRPRPLTRGGAAGFDALVKLAKVDAAPATVLSLLKASRNVEEKDGEIHLLTSALVPDDFTEKLKAAVATLVPHLEITVGNVVGDPPQWDQALRYSHLSQVAAQTLEEKAAELSLDMLQKLNAEALKLQNDEEGANLFVAGTFIQTKAQDQ